MAPNESAMSLSPLRLESSK